MKVFPCGQCGKLTGSQRQLDSHVRKSHNNNEEKELDDDGGGSVFKYVCEQCPKRFHKKANLESHALRHSDVKSIRCTLCAKTFKRMKALRVHHDKAHNSQECGEITTNLCSFCGKKFKSFVGLQLHLAKHTGNIILSI